MFRNLENSLINSAIQGTGAMLAVDLLSEGNAPAKLFGMDMNLGFVVLGSVVAGHLLNEFVVQDYVVPYVPDSAKPLLSSAGAIGQVVTEIGIPIALVYWGNMDAFSVGNALKMGAFIYLGGAGGSYLYEKILAPGASQMIN